MAKDESPLFVGVTDGDNLRRSILECSKGILESLKEHGRFKNIREEKMKIVHKLRGEVKELSRLINSLRTYLPVIKEVRIKSPENIGVDEKPEMVKVEMPKKNTEVERLEEELSEIESKLNSLS